MKFWRFLLFNFFIKFGLFKSCSLRFGLFWFLEIRLILIYFGSLSFLRVFCNALMDSITLADGTLHSVFKPFLAMINSPLILVYYCTGHISMIHLIEMQTFLLKKGLNCKSWEGISKKCENINCFSRVHKWVSFDSYDITFYSRRSWYQEFQPYSCPPLSRGNLRSHQFGIIGQNFFLINPIYKNSDIQKLVGNLADL